MRISDWSSDVCSSDLLREFRYRFRERLDQQRQQGQLGAVLVRCIEMLAQRFQLGDVDFLDVGIVRYALLGALHRYGDLATQADNLDLLGRVIVAVTARRRRATARMTFNIVATDATGRSARIHLRDVDAKLACTFARRR